MMRPAPHELPFLEDLSSVLKRRLTLRNEPSSATRLLITAEDRAPVRDEERRVVEGIATLLQRNATLRSELAALDQRIRILERENVELTTKNRSLHDQTSRDPLTGLFHRAWLVETIEAEINRALRSGSSLAVLMVDVDHLRKVNERSGNGAGDLVLQCVANALHDSCRVYDAAGRYGGEEFCVMLPETRLQNALAVAERLRRKIESTPVVTPHGTIGITISIGIASLEMIPDEALLGASSLIDRADRALLAAKDLGRNRVHAWNGAMAAAAATPSH